MQIFVQEGTTNYYGVDEEKCFRLTPVTHQTYRIKFDAPKETIAPLVTTQAKRGRPRKGVACEDCEQRFGHAGALAQHRKHKH